MYTKAIYLLCWFFSRSLPFYLFNFPVLYCSLSLITQFEHKNYARFWCWWFKTSFPPINFKPHFRHFFIVMNTLDRFIFFLLRSFFLAIARERSIFYGFIFLYLKTLCYFSNSISVFFFFLHELWSIFVNPFRKFTENDLLSLVREFFRTTTICVQSAH